MCENYSGPDKSGPVKRSGRLRLTGVDCIGSPDVWINCQGSGFKEIYFLLQLL